METKKRCSDCKYWENDKADSPCFDCGSHSEWEAPFQPEYFSGLNWRDAEHLIGKVVEFSDEPDMEGWEKGVLVDIRYDSGSRFGDQSCYFFEYIRTTPETHAHLTITLTVNGQEWVLPAPETEPPERGIDYWIVDTYETDRYKWQDGEVDKKWLEIGIVHLTEARAQAWADLWREGILVAVKGVK